MMDIYTIGFTKKSAKEFFSILGDNKVSKVYDIRLNNSNQLAGFSKGRDLEFFLSSISNIEYSHEVMFAPTKEILDNYKKKNITWDEYEKLYIKLLEERSIYKYVEEKNILREGICFLCSEPTEKECHRRLLVEYLSKRYNIVIKHL